MIRLLAVAVAAALLAAGCTSPARSLRVLHTTDVHGYFGERPGGVGGARRLAARIERERAAGHDLLLVDSGDMWSGTLLSDRSEGTLGVALYNLLGYDAVALGNHEFDFGPVGPTREGGAEPLGALLERLAEARFPVLAANLVDRQTGELPAWPNLHASTIVERGGFRIGLIGVITQATPSITFPHVGVLLRFDDPAEAATREARRLRDAGAELVYVLAHVGGACRTLGDERDLSTCRDDSELFRMVRGLPPGLVDAVFGGHTHSMVRHRIGGIAMLQAGRYGEHVAQLDVRQEKGQATRTMLSDPIKLTGPAEGRLVRVVGSLLEPAENEAAFIRSEKLGARIIRPMPRDRDESSSLGTWLCDVLLAARPDREICMLNSGGLRRDLERGDLTYGALYDVMPFGNMVAELDVPGAVLRELVRLGTTGAHGVSQVGGLKVQYDRGQDWCPTIDRDGDGALDPDDRDRLVYVRTADGAELDPERTYKVVTNSFLARGGDGFRSALRDVAPERVRVLTGELPVRDVIAAWLRENRPNVNSPHQPAMPERRLTAVGEPATHTRCETSGPAAHEH